MEGVIDWLCAQGSWVEIAIIVFMVVVSLLALKLAVSAAARVIVLLISLAVIGASLYCLTEVREKRRPIHFSVKVRGRVLRARRIGLKRGARCHITLEGTFRRGDLKKTKITAKKMKQMNQNPAQGSKKPLTYYAPVEARCRVTISCSKRFKRVFDERGDCTYFFDSGRASYACGACPDGTLELNLRRNIAILGGYPPKKSKKPHTRQKPGRARLRLHIKSIKKPVL
jgi:hypothetical protein